MAETADNSFLTDGSGDALPKMHRFSRDAMATTFEIVIPAREDPHYARHVANEAFDELDRLEGELSRYVENSDISRLCNCPDSRPVQLGIDAFACLETSARIYHETAGAFDVTLGPLLDCWHNTDPTSPARPSDQTLALARAHTGIDLIELDPKWLTARLLNPPMQIDLGGVGKGYAVDRMAELLVEWDIDNALIHGGTSSVRALGKPPGLDGWPVTLRRPHAEDIALARLSLTDQALSGSNLALGQHIIDPRTAEPVAAGKACWLSAPTACLADALSTALMVMSVDEVTAYCTRHPDILALLLLPGDAGDRHRPRTIRLGPWQKHELTD